VPLGNINLIDNSAARIIGNSGEKRKQEENSLSLPTQCKSRVENGEGRISTPLWTEN
jgi:hypothetical protein